MCLGEHGNCVLRLPRPRDKCLREPCLPPIAKKLGGAEGRFGGDGKGTEEAVRGRGVLLGQVAE